MRTAIPQHSEVIIVGGGLAGLTLAASLGSRQIKTIVLERMADAGAPTRVDLRTTAIAAGPKALLEQAGIWPGLSQTACPILSIRIADQNSRHTLDFDHQEVGGVPFGFIVENGALRQALTKRLTALKSFVTIVAPAELKALELQQDMARVILSDGQIMTAQLVIGADGRYSPSRQLAGIASYGWDYDQVAFVCTIAHEIPHDNIAVEHFLAEGPLATLPMQDDPNPASGLRHRSSVVWTVSATTAAYLGGLTIAEFRDELQPLVAGWCGKIRLYGGFQSHPLQLQHARAYTAPRLALINEAAHRIHPVAGQGLNLGMRDIESLALLLTEAAGLGLDLGNTVLLKAYEASRRRDTLQMIIATDGLVKLFSNNIFLLKLLRQWGLSLVQHSSAARHLFMRTAMGA